MPFRRPVRKLQDIALENLIENIEYHANVFQKASHDEDLLARYHLFQYLFSDELLKKLCRAHFSKIWKDKSGLNFILNKYVKMISPNCLYCKDMRVGEEITTHILSTCKRVINVRLHRSHFDEDYFVKAISNWINVVKLSLSVNTCTNRMVCAIWDNLHNLQEFCLFHSFRISDECLLYLCKNHSNEGSFPLCQENGYCCNLGKKLKYLNIRETRITDKGIRIALLHLNSLEYLDCNGEWFDRYYRRSHALLDLVDTSYRKDNIPRSFKLKSLICWERLTSDQASKLLCACPYLEHVGMIISVPTLEELSRNGRLIASLEMVLENSHILDSSEFRKLLLKRGLQFRKMTLSIPKGSMSIRHVVEILITCKNLTELVVADTKLIPDESISISEFKGSFEKLNVLDMSEHVTFDERLEPILLRILKCTVNLKILKISSDFVHHMLKYDLRKRLRNLECLHIYYTSMHDVSLEHFLRNAKDLKEVLLRNCGRRQEFLTKCKEYIRRENLSVKLHSELAQYVNFYGYRRYHFWYNEPVKSTNRDKNIEEDRNDV